MRDAATPARRRAARAALALAVAMAAATSGCVSHADGARADFAARFQCPEREVQVVPRTDLSARDIAPPAEPCPPSLDGPACWRFRHDAEEERRVDPRFAASRSVFEVRGCGRRTIASCGFAEGQPTAGTRNPHPASKPGTDFTRITCWPGVFPTCADGEERPPRGCGP